MVSRLRPTRPVPPAQPCPARPPPTTRPIDRRMPEVRRTPDVGRRPGPGASTTTAPTIVPNGRPRRPRLARVARSARPHSCADDHDRHHHAAPITEATRSRWPRDWARTHRASRAGTGQSSTSDGHRDGGRGDEDQASLDHSFCGEIRRRRPRLLSDTAVDPMLILSGRPHQLSDHDGGADDDNGSDDPQRRRPGSARLAVTSSLTILNMARRGALGSGQLRARPAMTSSASVPGSRWTWMMSGRRRRWGERRERVGEEQGRRRLVEVGRHFDDPDERRGEGGDAGA